MTVKRIASITFSRKRCDLTFDCEEDASDEKDCSPLKMRSTYVKEIVPHVSGQPPVRVRFLFHILSIPAINTVESKFTINYMIVMSWKDSRLKFENLKPLYSENSLTSEDMQQIWLPKFFFMNAYGT